MSTPSALEDPVAAVRRFNRFYTRTIGALDEGHLHSPFSLAEVRVLYELANRRGPTATELGRDLGLDAGYLSRILRGLESRGLMERAPAPGDARQQLLRLTDAGRETFGGLNERANDAIAELLGGLNPSARQRLTDALSTVESLLEPPAGANDAADEVVLRPPRSGDYGWVVQRHGELYAREYGWDERFEALVADVLAQYVRNHDPAREACWIAERNGERLGCVFVVRKTDTVAQLRLLLVEPSARGLGVGKRLVAECTRFAREKGYRSIVLWTNNVLLAARHIYRQEGYHVVATETHNHFGTELTAETWEMDLDPSPEAAQDDVRE
jgi:DNA-binding MarR family transcriptional regulator/N-acetylglutamate synthase-like GNAT family acetyltransferase